MIQYFVLSIKGLDKNAWCFFPKKSGSCFVDESVCSKICFTNVVVVQQ